MQQVATTFDQAERGGAPAMSQPTWQEDYEGGSPEAERLLFERLAKDIMQVQLRQRKGWRAPIRRTFHGKMVLGVTDATLRFLDDLPPELSSGWVHAGAAYPTIARFSNANGGHQPDTKRDMRGVALRVQVGEEEVHDLLMTNFPVSHARNARQFVAFASAMAGSRLLVLPRLFMSVGPGETVRMLKNVLAGSKRPIPSLALETYWSRGAYLWGSAGPVRFLLRPAPEAPHAPEIATHDPDYLRREFAERLRRVPAEFDLFIQRYVDRARTPIEDGAVEWTEEVAPPIRVARLTIPQQDVDLAETAAAERLVDDIAFNPWHTTDDFRPLGNLNRARKAAYAASSDHRLGYRFATAVPRRNRIASRAAAAIFRAVNRRWPWHRLPLDLGLLNLALFREELREKNLIDTEVREAPPKATIPKPPIPEGMRTVRTYDGRYNDLSDPAMGAIGATFGRNMPAICRPDLFDEPNPVTVSRELLHREHFIPARSLNILAAAWIQFQVHDWVNHARYPLGRHDIRVPMPGGTRWRNRVDGPEEEVMRIAADQPRFEGEETKGGTPSTLFANTASHWWDGSEVYGPDEAHATMLREGAKIRLDNGYLPEGLGGVEVTGFNENWWLGLSIMHTLFSREHNVLCDELRREYPGWSDERVYQTARLVVSALIAKIHTVEWTPAILSTEAIDIGLKANWYGAPKDWLTQLGLWLIDAHALKGIPETLPDHHTAPYCLTEDFVTVYRLHPLIPDDYRIMGHRDGALKRTAVFKEIQGGDTDAIMRGIGLEDALYSFGIAHPGAITLHNYPRALQAFERMNGERIDLSVVDIVRERHRGIPRYNGFREGLHKPRITRWEDLTTDPESVRKLKEIYREIDRVDTMVGLMAEPAPVGFGFSDTAFRIFILMATRRLQSDRFLTVDYRPEIYSPLGLDWIARNGMTSVILRHCPELAGLVPSSVSAFAPWRAVPAPRR